MTDPLEKALGVFKARMNQAEGVGKDVPLETRNNDVPERAAALGEEIAQANQQARMDGAANENSET